MLMMQNVNNIDSLKQKFVGKVFMDWGDPKHADNPRNSLDSTDVNIITDVSYDDIGHQIVAIYHEYDTNLRTSTSLGFHNFNEFLLGQIHDASYLLCKSP